MFLFLNQLPAPLPGCPAIATCTGNAKPILKFRLKQKYKFSQGGMRLKMGIKKHHPDCFLLLSKKLQEGGQRSEAHCKMSSSVNSSHLKGCEGKSGDASHQES